MSDPTPILCWCRPGACLCGHDEEAHLDRALAPECIQCECSRFRHTPTHPAPTSTGAGTTGDAGERAGGEGA
jgi:hypothetical protein